MNWLNLMKFNMNEVLNGTNFAKNSDFIFSEIISRNHFIDLKRKNPDLLILREYKYLKIDAIWYINPILELKENDVIFSHTEVVEILFKYLNNFYQFNNLKLITHQSDKSVDKYLFAKKPNNISQWYSTNVNYRDPSLFSIPIGVNNFFNVNFFNDTIQDKFFNSSSIIDRDNKVYVNFTLDTNTKHRKQAIKHAELMDKNYTLIDMTKDSHNYFMNISKSKYTLAPWGNGIDTHRFWEALYLGSCPVTVKHKNYSDFKNLPAIFLNDYSELNYPFLEKQYEKFHPSDIELLNINYWFNKIRSVYVSDSDIQKINFTEDLKSDISFHKLKIKFISLRKIVKYLIKKYTNPNNYYKYLTK